MKKINLKDKETRKMFICYTILALAFICLIAKMVVFDVNYRIGYDYLNSVSFDYDDDHDRYDIWDDKYGHLYCERRNTNVIIQYGSGGDDSVDLLTDVSIGIYKTLVGKTNYRVENFTITIYLVYEIGGSNYEI